VLLACGVALDQEAHIQGASGESERNMLKSEGLRRRVTPIAAGLLLAALLAVLVVLLWGERPAEAAFPGENGMIAYSYEDSFDEAIYIMDADPSTWDEDYIALSEGYDADYYYDDYDPAWSPDGQQIAFVSDRDGDEEIYVMDTDPSTKDITRITKNDTWDASPDWSPNGQRIAFEGDSGIIVKNSDGSKVKRLTFEADYLSSPTWQPIVP
jgi:WD40-like Beta Propeller Repeat